MAQTGKRSLSAAEDHVVSAGRARLLQLWTSAPFTAGQPSNFELEYGDTLISAAGPVDRFRSASAAESPSAAWAQQQLKHGIRYTVSAPTTMTVLVPHSYYYAQLRVPLWCNSACVRDILPLVVLAAMLAALATTVADIGPIVSLQY